MISQEVMMLYRGTWLRLEAARGRIARLVFGNVAGKVHSHRFPAANTALPIANEDAEQLKKTEDFLTSGALTVDIFALSPARR